MASDSPFWVSAFLDLAPEDHAAASAFWAQVTGYEVSEPRGELGEFTTLQPSGGDDFLRVQRLGAGPSRVHLDLHVADLPAATTLAVDLGARLVARPHPAYDVLASPGGLVFCHVTHRASRRPAARTWPGGGVSLVDQVCLDIPVAAYEVEVAFWAALTGWELRRSTVVPEFSHLVRPAGVPLRLLLQRLGEPEGPVRAHLDLAVSDRAAETARHLALGARVRGPADVREYYTVLQDPAGSAYCLTDRDPVTGMLF